MLTRLNLVNFRNHAQTDLVSLKPLSVIVGPNGGGKSSILEAIRALYRLGMLSAHAAVGGQRGVQEVVRKHEEALRVAGTGTFEGEHWSLRVLFDKQARDWNSSIKVGLGNAPLTDAKYRGNDLDVPDWFLAGLRGVARYRLQASALREPSYLENLPPTIGLDGYGLASAVSYLMRTDPESHRLLTERLRSIVPSVTGLRTNPVKVSRTREHSLSVDNRRVPFNTQDEVVGDELLFDTVDGVDRKSVV